MLTESSWWGSPKDSVVLTRRIDNRLAMEWEPPPPDFLIFNGDGATIECPGMTGSGGVLRDDKGAMLAINKSCPYSFHPIEKIYANGLIVESDSNIAVCWCKNKSDRPWKLGGIFSDIVRMVTEIGSVFFKMRFVKRMA
ncbi:14.7 kDa ribonuclease H-like protein [Gossypium australe]|uniref:14.7 kDa ribonuclease H-like protein n=1 Tax=Gossypium australe TaxID=47621 RepID=A0A5B6WVR3_9ROSI|nr:14.7 kDa ribonuclease H-like protein [Gossypium australe]